MSASVRGHYDGHLGPVYSWMAGGFEAAADRARALFRSLGIGSSAGGRAIDLGSGPGFHAIPLAELGWRVDAFDVCTPLVEELRARAGELPIAVHHADLLAFRTQVADGADLVLCLGDTLTHLSDPADVGRLIADVSAVLVPGGRVVLAFRDFTRELHGDARFIPVRNDADRIFTCFLEYLPDRVRVHDLLYTRDADKWRMTVSSYPKLRLSPDEVVRLLQTAGLSLENRFDERGMTTVVAVKP
jgi:SAM-dependent methyltransferase